MKEIDRVKKDGEKYRDEISQNLGPEHAMTTYNSYGKLNERDQITAIANLSKVNVEMTGISTDKIMAELQRRMVAV